MSGRGLAFAMLALLCFGQEADKGPGFLRPLDQSILKPGALSVVARTEGDAKLLLDGKPVESKSDAAGVLSAIVKLDAGKHELVLVTGGAEHKARLFVGEGAPAGFEAFRAHPPAAACTACHAVEAGAWGFKGGSLKENCLVCHDQKTFVEAHQHTPEVLEECSLCHQPHGSKVRFHLKYDRDTACKLCHG